MKCSEKALRNGWGWVLGVSGQEYKVYSQQEPADEALELLGRVEELLGVKGSAGVLPAIRSLQRGQGCLDAASPACRATGEARDQEEA